MQIDSTKESPRPFRKTKIAFVGIMVLALTGCAGAAPDISDIQPVSGSAMTDTELQKTMDEMAAEKKRHKDASAI